MSIEEPHYTKSFESFGGLTPWRFRGLLLWVTRREEVTSVQLERRRSTYLSVKPRPILFASTTLRAQFLNKNQSGSQSRQKIIKTCRWMVPPRELSPQPISLFLCEERGAQNPMICGIILKGLVPPLERATAPHVHTHTTHRVLQYRAVRLQAAGASSLCLAPR